MEKRLLLAITLSAAVMLLWNYLGPQPPPKPKAPAAVGAGQNVGADVAPGAGATAQPARDLPPPVSEVVTDDQERTLVVDIGQPGEVGAYRALFSNRGGRLVELQVKSYVDRVGLSDEERADPEHWTSLVRSASSRGVATGSLLLRSDLSSREFEREPFETALWKMRPYPDAQSPRGVEFELAQGSGLRLIKRAVFEPGSYRLHVDLELVNDGVVADRAVGFRFTPAEVMPLESGDTFYVEPQSVAAGRTLEGARQRDSNTPKFVAEQRDDKAGPEEGPLEAPSEEISFAGVHNKYFAMLMRGADLDTRATIKSARWRRVADDDWLRTHPDAGTANWRYMATDLVLELRTPPQGERRKYEYIVYAGPKQSDLLVGDFADHQVLLEHDRAGTCCVPIPFVTTISNALTAMLVILHRLTSNWGVAIILLTLLVRAALFPVNRKSQTAMARFQKRMKKLQPQIDEIKKRFADDQGKQREAQQKLMAQHGMIPPLGGCLPMFVQIPVFFGLFSALRTSFELRQQPFMLWMHDLSKPDQLLELHWNSHLPLIGTIEYLNLLPILMVVLWVAQQALMPKPNDEQQAQMQKMMMFMPIIMGFTLYNYAAGLSLYMITTSSIGILENTVIKKLWPIDDSEPPASEKKDGFIQKMMKRAQEMQNLQDRRSRDGKGGKDNRGGKKR